MKIRKIKKRYYRRTRIRISELWGDDVLIIRYVWICTKEYK